MQRDEGLTPEGDGEAYSRHFRRRIKRKRRPPGRTMLLSFLWPGLGQWYARQRRRALLYALPPLALVLGLAAAVAADPLAFVARLLVPWSAALLVGLIVLDALWRSASLIDAWRKTHRAPFRSDRSAPLLAALVAVVLILHGFAGYYVASVGAAGAKIFQGGTGSADVGPPGSTGGPITQPNRLACPVVDPGDGTSYGDAPDDPHEVDEPDDQPDPIGTPVAPFDPAASPPPYVCDPAVEGELPPAGPINVLIVGLDYTIDRQGVRHPKNDVTLVVSYFPERNQLAMISIPLRTARVPLYTGGIFNNRLTYFQGYVEMHPEKFPEGRVTALRREIGYLLGIPIHFYAEVKWGDFPGVVDAVGGVDMTIDEPVTLPNPGTLAPLLRNGKLPPGEYHFDGWQALYVARSSGAGRESTTWQRGLGQQKMIRALAERVRDPAVALNVPQIMGTLSDVVRTDMKPEYLPDVLPMLYRALTTDTKNYVLEPDQYSQFIRTPRWPDDTLFGKSTRWAIELNIAAIRQLSLNLFGEYSLYHADVATP